MRARDGVYSYLATALALFWLVARDSVGPVTLGLLLFGGAAFGVLGFLLIDLLGAIVPKGRVAAARLRWVAAAVVSAPLVMLAVIFAKSSGLVARMPEVLPVGLVVAALGVFAVGRLASRFGAPEDSRFWAGAIVAGLELMALFVYMHVREETFVVVREGTERLHEALFFGTWLVSIALVIPWASRIAGRVGTLAPPRERWLWTAGAGVLGLLLLEVDRRQMVGLYPAVHLWLEFVGVLSLDAALGRLLAPAAPQGRQVSAQALARLRALGTGALAVIVCAALLFGVVAFGGLVRDRGLRAQLSEAAVGPSLLRLMRRSGDSGPKKAVSLNHELLHEVPPPANDWNIILISVDAFRGDFIPDPGDADKSGAPRLAELASTCADFRRAYAPGSRTAIGMGGLMLGRYSAHIDWQMWIWDGGLVDPKAKEETIRRLGNDLQYTTIPTIPPEGNLAQRLQGAGLYTMATPWDSFSKFFRKGNGFDSGFDDYTDVSKYKWREPASPNVLPLALEQIKRAKGRRFFQWIHLFDPHDSHGDRKKYGELVQAMDTAIGEFIDTLDKQGLRKKTAIVLLADHGEGLGDHRHQTHGTSLYEEQVKVPLLVCLPGREGQVFRQPVSTIDATATMLALAGADLTGIDGVNLLPLIEEGRYPERRPVFTELHRYQSSQAERTKDLQAVVLDEWKLIKDRQTDAVTLFNLEADPKEARNVFAAEPAVAEELEDLLDALNDTRIEPKPPPPRFAAKPAAFEATDSAVMLWVRTTLPTEVFFELSTSKEFTDVRATPPVAVDKSTDFVHVAEPTGLEPGTRYYYRPVLMHEGQRQVGDVGTFKTAPAEPQAVKLAWSADLMSDHAPFKIFNALSREKPDLFLMLGDTMYSDIPKKNRAKDLKGFRGRHWTVRRDKSLQSFLASTATATVWDDHEISNNSHRESKHIDIARQAFREQWPVRGVDPSGVGLYRSFRPAPQVEVFMLDVRSFRDPPKDRSTMLGAKQKEWFVEALTTSMAPTKIVVSAVPMLVPFGDDSWFDFPAERDELRALFARQPKGSVIVLSADFHMAWHLPDHENGFHEFLAGPLAAWVFKSMRPQHMVDIEKSGTFAITDGPSFGVLEISAEGQVTVRYLDGKGKERYRFEVPREAAAKPEPAETPAP